MNKSPANIITTSQLQSKNQHTRTTTFAPPKQLHLVPAIFVLLHLTVCRVMHVIDPPDLPTSGRQKHPCSPHVDSMSRKLFNKEFCASTLSLARFTHWHNALTLLCHVLQTVCQHSAQDSCNREKVETLLDVVKRSDGPRQQVPPKEGL